MPSPSLGDPTSLLLPGLQTLGISHESEANGIHKRFRNLGLIDTHGSIFHFDSSNTKKPSKSIFGFSGIGKSALTDAPSSDATGLSAEAEVLQALPETQVLQDLAVGNVQGSSNANKQVVIYDASKASPGKTPNDPHQKRNKLVQQRGTSAMRRKHNPRPTGLPFVATQPDDLEARLRRSRFVAITDKVRELNTNWMSINVHGNLWTIAPECFFEAHQEVLRDAALSPSELLKCDFKLVSPSEEGLKAMRRCTVCLLKSDLSKCRTHGGQPVKVWNYRTGRFVCVYSCCSAMKTPSSPGCMIRAAHDLESLEVLKIMFTYQPSPSVLEKPAGLATKQAMVIKCGLGLDVFGRYELVSFVAIDFHTAEVMIDMLVYPTVPILHWKTNQTRTNEGKMNEAAGYGEHLGGWQEARDLLCSYINQATVLIGENMKASIEALRLTHRRIIDVGILIPRIERERHDIQGLANRLLDKCAGACHRPRDLLDDALLARELVFWFLKSPFSYMARLSQHCLQELCKEKKSFQRSRDAAMKLEAIRARTKAVQSARRDEREAEEWTFEEEEREKRAAKRVRN